MTCCLRTFFYFSDHVVLNYHKHVDMDWTQIAVPNPVERCSHSTVVVGE
jgi:hypothetical protein